MTTVLMGEMLKKGQEEVLGSGKFRDKYGKIQDVLNRERERSRG